jgi:PhnB protein
MGKAKTPVPEGFQTVTPVLTFDDSTKAIDWYRRALNAEEVSCSKGPDGKVMHAEIRIGSSHIMMHDAMRGRKSPAQLGGSPASLWLYVDDSDALFNQAVAAGATVEAPMGDQFWGDRFGAVTDPFGYGWAVATHKEDLTPEEMQQRQAEYMKNLPQPTHS